MITDTIAPIVVPEGVGTISTLSGKDMLTKGLRFAKTVVGVEKRLVNVIYGIKYVERPLCFSKTLYLTPDATVYTIDGWKTVEEIAKGFDEDDCSIPYTKLLGTVNRCILCGDTYYSSRTSFSTCSRKCIVAMGKKNKAYIASINCENVDKALSEQWVFIDRVVTVRYALPMEVLYLKSVVGASGIYVNNLMVSCRDIIESGYNGEKG